jgi:hypothetical protein
LRLQTVVYSTKYVIHKRKITPFVPWKEKARFARQADRPAARSARLAAAPSVDAGLNNGNADAKGSAQEAISKGIRKRS